MWYPMLHVAPGKGEDCFLGWLIGSGKGASGGGWRRAVGEGRRRGSLEAQGGVLPSRAGVQGLLRGPLNSVFLWGVEGREGLRPKNGSALGPPGTHGQRGKASF